MKVGELIEALKEFDPNLKVVTMGYEYGCFVVDKENFEIVPVKEHNEILDISKDFDAEKVLSIG